MLRDSDQSRIRYKRVSEADGEEVPWEHIVKGYEYEKGKYAVITKEDFERVQIKSNQTVDIKEFVKAAEIEPRYFDQPYFLAPEKGGAKAYALLFAVLKQTGKVGIAKVVIRPPREHLAALRPLEGVLGLDLLHYADELRDHKELKIELPDVGEKELNMARALVESMSSKWKPENYRDDYREALMELIEQKVQSKGKLPEPQKAGKMAAGVVDLVAILQQSIDQATKSGAGRAPKKKAARRKAA
jgi:DNA end-binding protein Ku